MARIVVEKPFNFLDDTHVGRIFRPGVHEVDDKLVNHWWFKANGVKPAPADSQAAVLPVEYIGASGAYPVVEQTKNAEEGDIENTGAVPTSVNQGVKVPTPGDPNPTGGPDAPGPRLEAAQIVAEAGSSNLDPKPGDRANPDPAPVDPNPNVKGTTAQKVPEPSKK